MSLRERFYKKTEFITESGCLIFMGAPTKKSGYCQIQIKGKHLLAHRVAWELEMGSIPKGLLVLHHCDTPACVNHRYLFLGTYNDNKIDQMKKHRHPVGEHHGSSKLKATDIYSIRKDLRDDNEIAKEYGVNRATIYRIKKRMCWKHI